MRKILIAGGMIMSNRNFIAVAGRYLLTCIIAITLTLLYSTTFAQAPDPRSHIIKTPDTDTGSDQPRTIVNPSTSTQPANIDIRRAILRHYDFTGSYHFRQLTVDVAGTYWHRFLDSAGATLLEISQTGTVNIPGNLSIGGTATIGTLSVSGNSTLSGNLPVAGILTANSTANIDAGTLFVDATNNRVGIGTTPAYALDVAGSIRASGQFISTITGTPPLVVSSSSLVANLNADLLDGLHSSDFAPASGSGSYIWASPSTVQGAYFWVNQHSTVAANLNVSGNVRLATDAGTNVAIGNVVPGEKLRVDGAVKAEGFKGPDGTAGTPAYRFTSEADVGMYRPAVDTLGFSTTGTERMRIDALGNLGIGTTTPAARLYVRTTDTTTVPFQVEALVPPLPGWQYRKPITISNTASAALTNYQVLVTVDTASLIAAGKMQSTGADIRFTDSDGTTPLNYWIESGINTTSTIIWVKVPSIPASSTKTIYMYYGNPSATAVSNGDITFEFFDDFNAETVGTKWQRNDGAAMQDTEGTYAYIVSPNSQAVIDSVANESLTSKTFFAQRPVIIEAKGRQSGAFGSYSLGIQYYDPAVTVDFNQYAYHIFTDGTYVKARIAPATTSTDYSGDTVNLALNTLYIVRMELTPTDVIGRIFNEDRTLKGSISIADTTHTSKKTGMDNYVNSVAGNPSYFDWFLVRKYTSPEPTTSVGPEETATAIQQTVFYIQNQTGRVGIGTTNPSARLHVVGDFYATGTKNAIVRTSQGDVALYCEEASEVWFADYGSGQLKNGRAHIELDPLFLETVTIDDNHPVMVFVQLRDNCNGVYVVEGKTGFDVIELNGGKSNARFWYRVLAKRKGYENVRLMRLQR